MRPAIQFFKILSQRLLGLRQPLKLGDRFKIILDFLNSGEVEIEVFVEESATLFEEVLVSAGQRGYDVRLALADLIALTGAAAVRAI